jgi:altronate hydrolase
MSLLHIQSAPTAESATIHLHPSDNVAIARVALAEGQAVRVAGREIRAVGFVPAGHKIALREIAAGESVIRYGSFIGRASRAIHGGEAVHTHNLAFEETVIGEELLNANTPVPPVAKEVPTFLGYLREDGRVGTRNYIAVAAASNCSAHVVELIAQRFPAGSLPEGVDGVVAFPHGEGCGHTIGPDTRQLERVLSGVLDHPNVAAGVLLGLGCEVNQIGNYFPAEAFSELARTTEPGGPVRARRTERLIGMTLQASGGTQPTVDAGVREVKKLIERAAAQRRVPVSASKIVLGLNCGGSDSFSGISANPALGVCSDMLARIGATAVLAETTEIFGAEQLLLRRARNRQVAEKLMECVRGYKRYLSQFGGSSFDDNPTPGNKSGGLSNILEKSLGAVAKSGTSPLMDVVDYAERIRSPGLVFMNTPGYDPVSLTGLAAGGANMIAFTTGRGSAIGFPTVPVVKIATNAGVFERMRGNMDINAGRILEGEASIEEIGREIFERVLAAASGQRTSSELLGHHEFVPWRIGPVL